jgi:hypothetical protein
VVDLLRNLEPRLVAAVPSTLYIRLICEDRADRRSEKREPTAGIVVVVGTLGRQVDIGHLQVVLLALGGVGSQEQSMNGIVFPFRPVDSNMRFKAQCRDESLGPTHVLTSGNHCTDKLGHSRAWVTTRS